MYCLNLLEMAGLLAGQDPTCGWAALILDLIPESRRSTSPGHR